MGSVSLDGVTPMGQPGIPFSGVEPDQANQAVLDALTGPLNLRPYHTLEPPKRGSNPLSRMG